MYKAARPTSTCSVSSLETITANGRPRAQNLINIPILLEYRVPTRKQDRLVCKQILYTSETLAAKSARWGTIAVVNRAMTG